MSLKSTMDCRYKHIIWDWNGTLLDDTCLCVQVLNQMLVARNQAPISLEFYRKYFKFPVIDFYNRLRFKANADNFGAISREFIENYQKRWLLECQLHPNTVSILSAIQKIGTRQSVLSAAEQTTLEAGIVHYGINHYFTSILGTNNIEATGKRQKGLELKGRLECDMSKVLLIGDTLHDFEVAEAIGCDCALITHGHNCHHQLKTASTHLLDQMNDIIPLITKP